MTILTSSADLLDDILFRAGEPIDGTSDFADAALRALNRAYRAIWMGGGELVKGMNEPWLWLKSDPPGTLILQPIKDSGTVSVTNNSASATLSATVASSVAGWFFKVADHPDIFRVSAHTAGTAALTLDSVYTGEDDSTATYQLMKLEYDLAADLLRLISPMRVQSDNRDEIEGIDLPSLDRDYPLTQIETGTPDRFALVTETSVRFNRSGGTSSTDLRRVEYDYLVEPSDLADDSTEPLVPVQHRSVLSDLALAYLLQTKSDARAVELFALAKAGLEAMGADNRAKVSHTNRSSGRIFPRSSHLRRFDRPLRTSSGFIIG